MNSIWPITALKACDIAKMGYAGGQGLEIEASIDFDGVQALLAIERARSVRVLLIQGTNERSDWAKYNFRFWPDKAEGAFTVWHGGFLEYAQLVYAFAKTQQADVVVGHSLGAAAAQIVGPSLNLPTIGLASPKPLHRSGRLPKGFDKVINLCRTDDLVCRVPFKWWGYKHVGRTVWFKPKDRHVGEDHGVTHYREIISAQGDPLKEPK